MRYLSAYFVPFVSNRASVAVPFPVSWKVRRHRRGEQFLTVISDGKAKGPSYGGQAGHLLDRRG
jgi:hypothetical protein